MKTSDKLRKLAEQVREGYTGKGPLTLADRLQHARDEVDELIAHLKDSDGANLKARLTRLIKHLEDTDVQDWMSGMRVSPHLMKVSPCK